MKEEDSGYKVPALNSYKYDFVRIKKNHMWSI